MRNITFLIVLFLIDIPAFSQTKVLTGKITDDATGTPLQGVSIKLKNAKTGTFTLADGSYSISAIEGEQLVISWL